MNWKVGDKAIFQSKDGKFAQWEGTEVEISATEKYGLYPINVNFYYPDGNTFSNVPVALEELSPVLVEKIEDMF